MNDLLLRADPPWVRALKFGLLAILMVVLLFPFVEMLSTAMKPRDELFHYPPSWLPETPTLFNFAEVWRAVPLAGYFRNSLIIAGGATILNALAAIPAGYALARFSFPGRRVFLYFVVATQMFSPVVMLLATFRQMHSFGLLNTHWSLILINATVALPFTVWMMTAYFSTIPKEIEEAAILDRTGRWRMLWDHFLPLAMPGVVTAMTFCFVIAWNEFLFALTFITDADLRPLTTGIYAFVGRFEIQWHYLMAASLFSVIPVFIGFLLVQRRLVSGLAAGAVK